MWPNVIENNIGITVKITIYCVCYYYVYMKNKTNVVQHRYVWHICKGLQNAFVVVYSAATDLNCIPGLHLHT